MGGCGRWPSFTSLPAWLWSSRRAWHSLHLRRRGLWLSLLNGVLGLGYAYFRYTKRDRLSAGILLILVGLVSLYGLFASSLWGLGTALMGLISSGLVALGAYITYSSRGGELDGPGQVRKAVSRRPEAARDHTEEAAPAPTPTVKGPIDDPARRREEHVRLKDTGLLPSLKASVLKIVSAANRVRSFQADERELADAVQRDPAISANVMQRATRADIGIPSLSKKNMTAPYAVQLLGPQVTLNIAIGSRLVEEHRDGSCIGFKYNAFWHECVARATAAREITYSKRRAFSPEVAYTAGLLCQIGRLSFATVFPKVYAEMIYESGNLPDVLRELEFRRFRIDRNELAAEMMADWGLAGETWQAVLYQDQQDDDVLPFDSPAGIFAATLRWSGMVWSIIRTRPAPVADELVQEAVRLAEKLGVPADGFDPLIGEIKKRRREEAAFFRLAAE
jgi:HD-like signal output (HDOD) protein